MMCKAALLPRHKLSSVPRRLRSTRCPIGEPLEARGGRQNRMRHVSDRHRLTFGPPLPERIHIGSRLPRGDRLPCRPARKQYRGCCWRGRHIPDGRVSPPTTGHQRKHQKKQDRDPYHFTHLIAQRSFFAAHLLLGEVCRITALRAITSMCERLGGSAEPPTFCHPVVVKRPVLADARRKSDILAEDLRRIIVIRQAVKVGPWQHSRPISHIGCVV